MITNFYIEESYKRFCGFFNDIYSKNIKLNNDLMKIMNNLENKFNLNGRNLYVCDNDDNFINTVEIKNKKMKAYKYVTREYYNKHKHIYDKLFELNIYNLKEYKQFITERLEIYIFNNFNCRDILNNFDFKIEFVKEKLHGKINIDNLNFITRNEQKGTFVDYCIKYIINNDYDYAYSYLMSCNKSIDNSKIPNNLEDCLNTKDLIDFLFEKDFIEKILKLKENFISIKTSECYINFDLFIYGEPDLITDNYIIDIKTTENKKIDSKKNYLQTLFYAIMTNKNNICLYDPINGDLYKYQLTSDNIKDIKIFIKNYKKINNIKKYTIEDYFEKEKNIKVDESFFIL